MITDSFGRAWRTGQCDVAIGLRGRGAARGLARTRRTATGREMHATVIAVADQLAAAADLARRKDAAPAGGADPRRRGATSRAEDGPGVSRAAPGTRSQDLFR